MVRGLRGACLISNKNFRQYDLPREKIIVHRADGIKAGGGGNCVFKWILPWTFETTTKCNSIHHV